MEDDDRSSPESPIMPVPESSKPALDGTGAALDATTKAGQRFMKEASEPETVIIEDGEAGNSPDSPIGKIPGQTAPKYKPPQGAEPPTIDPVRSN